MSSGTVANETRNLKIMPTLPRYDKRTAIIGSTGSGKTQFAVWLLSSRDFDFRPWVIFDFKGDELIGSIGAQEVSINAAPPRKAGLYVVRPIPERDDKAVEEYLWKIWEQGNTGIYIDEGYMLGRFNAALNACLTQGRSKHIEMIVLSQRPVWMPKFVFSEANFFAVFNVTLKDDRKVIQTYLGDNKIDLLPKYHCLWYDVDKQEPTVFSPVPDRVGIISVFQKRMQKRVKVL